MAGPLDRAYIEITAELDTRQAQRAAVAAGRSMENELSDGVRRAEQNMSREAARVGQNVGRTIADSTGEALGDGLRRNASGRIVDAQGRFVSAARLAGMATGTALAEGIGDGLENGFKRDVNGRLRDQYGRFVPDGRAGGERSGSAFGDGFGSGLFRRIGTVFKDALSSITDIKLPVAAFATLGLGLASAAASAVQLTAALAPAVGIIAALPSGIGVLSAGMSTLSVATMGVGDAFGAAFGDAEEFEEAMEGLAPSVQAAAQALRDMAPQLDALRDQVQDAFFQDFDDILNSLADTLLGPVTEGMTSVASSINGLLVSLSGVATSAEGVEFVNQSFAIMSTIIQNLQEPLTLLFSSLLSVGNAIGAAFGEEAGMGLANMITRFAEFLAQAAASGQAVAWVENALAVFQAIGDILSPLVGILGSIGAAAQATGGNILGVFGQLLGVLDEFLASAQGQSALIAIFEGLNTVGSAFSTVLQGIAPAIPPIVSGIASILGVVAPLLGPLSQLVGSVLTALAPILGVVAAAIQPIIGPLTEIISLLGPILVDAITTLMPVIELLADLLGGALGVAIEVVGAVLEALAPILMTILDALEPLITALEPLFEILGVIADLIGTVLEPIITVLGDILLWLVENVIIPLVIPALELIAEVLTVVLGTAIQWLVQQFQLAGQGIEIIWNFIKDLIVQRVEEITTGWDNLVILFKVGWTILNNQVFTPLKNGFNALKNAATTQIDNIKSGFNTFVSFVKGIPGKISGALSGIFSPLWDGFKSAINSVIRGWNSLSFSVPSVDLGPLGSTPGVTVSTPNIPYLARGALATGPTLAMVGEGSGPEAILPLEDPRVTDLLASALSRAGVSGQATAGANGGQINAVAQSGDNYFTVKIGERELIDIVVEQQNAANQQMLRRARSGTRRNH
jgi:phage-related protein